MGRHLTQPGILSGEVNASSAQSSMLRSVQVDRSVQCSVLDFHSLPSRLPRKQSSFEKLRRSRRQLTAPSHQRNMEQEKT